jgi:hypothetical protein
MREQAQTEAGTAVGLEDIRIPFFLLKTVNRHQPILPLVSPYRGSRSKKGRLLKNQ